MSYAAFFGYPEGVDLPEGKRDSPEEVAPVRWGDKRKLFLDKAIEGLVACASAEARYVIHRSKL